ncbi:MAG: tetratricopeptide repeat protein [Candidatus Methylomirabilia bacterium]
MHGEGPACRVRVRGAAALLLGVLLLLPQAPPAAGNSRRVLIAPYATAEVAPEEQWLGEAVAQILSLALAQHPAFLEADRRRLAKVDVSPVRHETAILAAARSLRADAAFSGEIRRVSADRIVIRPRYLEVRNGDGKWQTMAAASVPEGKLLDQLALLALAYFRAFGVSLSDAEAGRIQKAARPTSSLQAFEAFVRGRTAAMEGTPEGNSTAADLLARAAELDPYFVVAQYSLGVVNQELGNRWKAAAHYRASIQLDPSYPEPFKALGDLFLSAPRRLFDQAVEAYEKALELRPFYADAYVGLGDAKAAKGAVDEAVAAYQRALEYDPTNPRVYLSLGKLYYLEKGLYYEAVKAYEQAIELDPEFVDARMGLGELYEDKGLYEGALAEYGKVIELEPRHTGALYNRALVYEKVDPRTAIAHWEHYIAVASHLPSEKDWVDVARRHLKKLKTQLQKNR